MSMSALARMEVSQDSIFGKRKILTYLMADWGQPPHLKATGLGWMKMASLVAKVTPSTHRIGSIEKALGDHRFCLKIQEDLAYLLLQ